jgi:hypothetical protein
VNSQSQSQSQSQSYVTTDGQPASLSWNKAAIWGLRPDFDYCLTVAGLLIWGALSDERTGLSFLYAVGPCQGSLSRLRVPWDSRPYFTVSDLRLPFSSPPKTRRVTVEVFHPEFSYSTCIVACVSVAPGTCLPSRCLETTLIYLLISRSLHSKGSTCYNNNNNNS